MGSPVWMSLCALLFLSGVEGQRTVIRVNEALEVGQQYTMNCTEPDSGTSIRTQWFKGITRIYDSDDASVNDPDFELSDRLYDLRIHQVDLLTSAGYYCDMTMTSGGILQSYYGIAAIDGPECTNDKVLLVGDNLNVDCDFTYRIPPNGEYKFTPTVRWVNEDDQDQPVQPQPTEEPPNDDEIDVKYRMTDQASVEAHHDVTFTCLVVFEVQDAEPDAEGPTYLGSCTTHIYVEYTPRDVEIQPRNEDGSPYPAQVGDFFNCTASAYPEPTYYWNALDGAPEVPNRWQLEVTEEHVGRTNRYQCQVVGAGVGDPDATAEITFFVEETQSTTESSVQDSTTESSAQDSTTESSAQDNTTESCAQDHFQMCWLMIMLSLHPLMMLIQL